MKSLGNYFPFRRVFLTKEVIFIAYFLINATQLRGNSSSTLGQLRVNSYKTSARKSPSVAPPSIPPVGGRWESCWKMEEPEFLLVSKIIVRRKNDEKSLQKKFSI